MVSTMKVERDLVEPLNFGFCQYLARLDYPVLLMDPEKG
jgi:hypothetical protein